jgi:hypothetical protein
MLPALNEFFEHVAVELIRLSAKTFSLQQLELHHT